jgi:methyl-accepting chemotaxis protein
VQALEHANGARLPAIVRLQAAQLDNSRRTFESSIEQIRNSLARIERQITEVAEESAHLLGRSGNAEESYFSGVESDLASILDTLEASRRADQFLREAAVSIRERVSGMSQTISGVHTVGLEMQRLALNATIQAVKLGEDGGALEIVAYAARNLAQNAGTAASTIEKLLTDMNDGVSRLESSTAASGGSEAQIAQLRGGLDGLRSVQVEVRGAYDRTTGLIAGLNERIGEAISAFGAPDEFLDVLAGAGTMLHDLSADAGSVDSAAADEIAATYTMDSERAVHKALYEGVSETPAAHQDNQEDNVEFF